MSKNSTPPPLILGHRGASGAAPENTLKAFQKALEAKADGIELDVFLTSDGEIVVTHDEKTKRLTGVTGLVRKKTLQELSALDFGEGEKIPTLESVFKRFGKDFAVINVEIKSTGLFTDGIESKVAELIQKHQLQNKIVVSSFNPFNLYRFRKVLPEVRIAYLVDPKLFSGLYHRRIISTLKPDQLNLHPASHRNPATRFLFEGHLPFWLWGIDRPKRWDFACKSGCQGLITDFPEELRSAPEFARPTPRKF